MTLKRTIGAFHQKLVDPRQRGLCLGACRDMLGLAAIAFGTAVRLRNRAYDCGLVRLRRAEVPVISVGNITAGGTGKTPFAAWLAGLLVERGRRPAILSRGYGADPRTGLDDENRMLAALAPGIPVVADPDRARGASCAIAEHGADVLVLDDGFQHRRLARDLDIVLVDSLRPFGGGHLLPRGLLREPLNGLTRAGAVVLTRSDQAEPPRLQGIKEAVARYAGQVPIALAVHRPVGLQGSGAGRHGGDPFSLEDLREGRWAAFCGLGNPEAFRLTLEGLGAHVARFAVFPDHHRYDSEEVAVLLADARRHGCRGLVTTEKDAIKVEPLLGGASPVPVLALQVRIEVRDGRESLEQRIRSVLGDGP